MFKPFQLFGLSVERLALVSVREDAANWLRFLRDALVGTGRAGDHAVNLKRG